MKLSDTFIEKYRNKQPLKQLGSFVYYRTYSRWNAEKGRRETWLETVRRAVEYNCSLDSHCTEKEAQELFDNVFNLRSFLAGRTFWIGGTQSVKTHPLANFNCAGIVIDGYEKFSELFYVLTLGVGGGVRISKNIDIKEKFPPIRYVKIINKKYEEKPKEERKESTSLEFTFNSMGEQNKRAVIIVGDSKEGWSDSLKIYLELLTEWKYDYITEIEINYDSVRPKGEELKQFGGYASGPKTLMNMFNKFNKIIKKRYKENNNKRVFLKSIDLLDFANIIAENVVIGGVRRSAEIVLFDNDDTEAINAKSELYKCDKDGNWSIDNEISHRQNSNNSILYWKKPTRKEWHTQIEKMRYSGEPGFINGENALRRNENFELVNPCAEILLSDRQTCNLVTLNLLAFVKDGRLDTKSLYHAQYLNARASYRMTLLNLELPKWNYKLHRDRLLGVSLTGYQDMVNALDMNLIEQQRLLKNLRTTAKDAANELAIKLGLNKSKLVTTIKPEGTLSLLPTVSSGLHFSHSPYFVRRVRINPTDPLVSVCKELNYPIFPDVGTTWENAKKLVIEFPVKSPKGRTKYNVSAIEQLEIYKMFMLDYVDHNASITVHVRDNEWEEVEEWVYNNWDYCIGISFLALSDSFYELLPFEKITEEEYNRRISEMKPFDPTLINKYDRKEDHDVGTDDECASGACPIR